MDKINLPNGCCISRPTVFPKNWATSQSSISKKWYIQYYFYDPSATPSRKLVIIKAGINQFGQVSQRRDAVKTIIANEIDLLTLEGYNPITKKFAPPLRSFDVSPKANWIDALNSIKDKISVAPHTLNCINGTIKDITSAARYNGLTSLPVSEVRRRHILTCLEYLKSTRASFGNPSYNRHRAYLSTLFKKLVQVEACEINPVREIDKLPEIPVPRTVLSDEQISTIHQKLPNLCSPLYRYVNIFYRSGARSTELLAVKVKDVNLDKREYLCTTRKGKVAKDILRPITMDALPFWQNLLLTGQPEDYIFSKNLQPGNTPGNVDMIASRWKTWIQGKLKIKVTFYALKHLHSTRISAAMGIRAAANFNMHSDDRMVAKVYNIDAAKQQLEISKQINVPL